MKDALIFTGLFLLCVSLAALFPLLIYHLYRVYWLREIPLVYPK